MSKFTYFHNKAFITLDESVSEELLTTLDNYTDDLYILLNEDQVKFKKMCPFADIQEVINLELTGEHKRRVLNKRAEEYKRYADSLFITMQHCMFEGDIAGADEARENWMNTCKSIKERNPYKYIPESVESEIVDSSIDYEELEDDK